MRSLPAIAKLLVGLVVAAALVGLMCLVQRHINRLRTSYSLTETTPLENAPPTIALTTVALGSFRGLAADWLWLRSNRLQEQGNYYEMYQIASWIVKLQPRYTGATAFLAWNMAYNISVTYNGFDDRWRWVRRGIELIRDEALLYNPGDPELLRELAWIYYHKLGQDMDDANRYYKREFALEMIKVLGDVPLDWEALAKSPLSEAELRRQLGQTSPVWTAMTQQNLTFAELESAFRAAGALPPAFDATLPPGQARQTLELSLRNRWLAEVFKLESRRLLALNRKYPGLDWRLPQAHAIYWAARGLEVAPGHRDLGCERMIFQSLAAAFKAGRLVYLKDTQTLETTPNIALIDVTNQSYLDAMSGKEAVPASRAAYENFLINATVILYTFGQEKTAAAYLQKLRDMYGGPRYAREVTRFVLDELAEDMTTSSYVQAEAGVQGYLLQSCFALALGDSDRAAAFEVIARHLWQKFMGGINLLTTDRRGLPPYANMRSNAVQSCLRSFPPGLASRLRRALPEEPEAASAAGAQPPAPAAGPGSAPPTPVPAPVPAGATP